MQHSQDDYSTLVPGQPVVYAGMGSADDCAWCGTGEGLCPVCEALLLGQSSTIATSGTYLADEGGQSDA